MEMMTFLRNGFFVVVAALAVSCQSVSRSAVPESAAEPVFVTDSISGTSGAARYSVVVDFPSDTSSVLALPIGEYVSEMLGGSYGGSCLDMDSMLEYYASSLSSTYADLPVPDFGEGNAPYYDNIRISRYAEGPGYITYMFDRELYLGGAHGSHSIYGMTFRKSDGRRIGWELFTGRYDDEFSEILREGLCGYWGLASSGELENYLFNRDDFYSVPYPECPPMFTPDGVEFRYNEYEISAYALGRPHFTVPYSRIGKYMMVTARRLIE